MPCLVSPLERANEILRLQEVPLRIRFRRRSQWLSVYEHLPGGGGRERVMRGYSALVDADIKRLCEDLVRSPAGPRSVRRWWRSRGARGGPEPGWRIRSHR